MQRRDAEPHNSPYPRVKTTIFNSGVSRIDHLKGRLENGTFERSPTGNGSFIHRPTGNGSFIHSPSGKGSLIHSPTKNGNFVYSPTRNGNFVYNSVKNANPIIPSPKSENGSSLYNPAREGNFKTATYQRRTFENSYKKPYPNGLLNDNHSYREDNIHVADMVKNKLAHIIHSKSSKLRPQFDKKILPSDKQFLGSQVTSSGKFLNTESHSSIKSTSVHVKNQSTHGMGQDLSKQNMHKKVQDDSESIKCYKAPAKTNSIACSNDKSNCSCNSTCNSECNIVSCSNINGEVNKLLHIEDKLILNRKHVKLKCSEKNVSLFHKNKHLNTLNAPSKDITEDSSDDDSDLEFYVLESSRRLALFQYGYNDRLCIAFDARKRTLLLDNIELDINIVFEKDIRSSTCQPKKMRSSPKERSIIKSTSSEDSCDEIYNSDFRCEWFQCNRVYPTVEKFTKHVKKEHIQPSSKNDVFVCLWHNCRFSNQPSCSYKWLSKHVLRHCDLKPFKCVIFGCDMAFATQNGLARHVPTHFNEGNVRRTCVRTNTCEASQHWESPKIKRNLHLKLNSVADINENSRDSTFEESSAHTRFDRFVGQNKAISITKDSFTPRMYDQLKRRIEQSSCSPVMNHGYIGKSLRVDHKVVGRRTLSNGEHDMLLAPTLDRVFPYKTMWFDACSFRQHEATYIDLPFTSISTDAKNTLYEFEHASKRRKRKRK